MYSCGYSIDSLASQAWLTHSSEQCAKIIVYHLATCNNIACKVGYITFSMHCAEDFCTIVLYSSELLYQCNYVLCG